MKNKWYLLRTICSIPKKSILFLAILTFTSGVLSADWNPEYLTDDNGNSLDITPLNDQRYKDLKATVLKSLAKSWCSQEKVNLLMDLMLITKPTVCVDIGTCTGSTVLPVAVTLKHLGVGKVYAIDAWSNEIAVRNWDDTDPNKAWWSKANLRGIRKNFKTLIKTWDLTKYCKILTMTSEDAVNQVPNNIGFLHLDGDYSEKGSVQDIELYLPKVAPGGYILLSGLFTMVNNKQPKLKAFCTLFDSCDIVAEIERDNAVLFRKR